MQKPTPNTVAYALAGFIACSLIIGGFLIRHELYRPVGGPTNQTALDANSLTEDTELLALQSKDTDGDTLSDYDELYVYDTSPYLTDSDSDGTGDALELQAQSDPNCPEGANCGIVATNTATNASVTNTNSNASPFPADAATLRDVLLNAGVPQETLDSISDDDLMAYYQSVIESETGSVGNANAANRSTNTGGGSTTDTIGSLEDFTTDEIRQFLEVAGVDKNLTDGLDDATLRTIFNEAIQETQSTPATNAQP